MSAEIYIYPYVLKSRSFLNAKTQRKEHHGVLIRRGDGFGCIHPWEELGDAALETQLNSLKKGKSSPLIECALRCVEADGDARRKGVLLFENLKIPQSHATLPLCENALATAYEAGFSIVKVKAGRDLLEESSFIQRMIEKYPDLRWRIDFNHTQSLEIVREWCKPFQTKIDFVEDGFLPQESPLPDDNICHAIDRDVCWQDFKFPVWVMKPAVNHLEPLMKSAAEHGRRVVVTSYMDHPLGQSYAAWQAGVYSGMYAGVVDVCGLATQGLFEPNAFTEYLGSAKPYFQISQGTGLGFDELLEGLPWRKLI